MSLTLLNARSEVGQFRNRDQGATCIPGQCLFFPSLINVRRYYSLLLPEFSLTVRVMIRSSNQHTVVQEVSRHQLDEQKKGNSVLFGWETVGSSLAPHLIGILDTHTTR
jgi:hypothetical protein